MKMLLKITLTAMALAIATLPTAQARDYVIALSHNVDEGTAQDLYEFVLELATEMAEPGSEVIVMDAITHQQVASFDIPDAIQARRMRLLQDDLNAFLGFVANHYVNSNGPAPNPINYPALMDEIGQQIFGGSQAIDRDLCVLVVGDAPFADPRSPEFHMVDSYVPSDGLIMTSKLRSPYGTLDRQGFLDGVVIHMLATNEWSDEFFKTRVERAWYLFTTSQGGIFSTFSTSADTVLARYSVCDAKPARTFGWDQTQTVEAMIASQFIVQQEAEREAVETEEDLVSRGRNDLDIGNIDFMLNESLIAETTPPDIEQARLVLGIRWGDNGRCAQSDIDLYARSSPDQEYLYYANTETAEGTYEKDFTASPDAENGLEKVEFTEAVRLAELEILINYYAGTCEGGVHGQVRALLNDRIYDLPFFIPAESGSYGEGSLTDNAWIKVDMAELFNL